VLCLQSALDSQVATQANVSQHEPEEASWSVLCAELTHQAEHTHQLEAAHARAKAELSTLCEHHTAIEVLHEEGAQLLQTKCARPSYASRQR
jgi:hypothetical protein